MKVVILAGGFGTRLSEETAVRPKPMVEVGGKPLLWHIMKGYAAYGLNEFIICCGYRGDVIKDYFDHYWLHNADMTFDLRTGYTEVHHCEDWEVTCVETGDGTQTGGRLLRVAPYLDGEDFAMTYGDGIGNVDISALVTHHKVGGTKATVTAVRPASRFGALSITFGGKVTRFREKPGDTFSSGGFFVLSPSVLDYIADDSTVWEHEPLARLTEEGELSAYHHDGFWHPMDTLSDRHTLEGLWASGKAPWKTW